MPLKHQFHSVTGEHVKQLVALLQRVVAGVSLRRVQLEEMGVREGDNMTEMFFLRLRQRTFQPLALVHSQGAVT